MIKKLCAVIPLIVISMVVSGCPSPMVVDTSCTVFGPIMYSQLNDSEPTVTAIRRHNAAWVKLCK